MIRFWWYRWAIGTALIVVSVGTSGQQRAVTQDAKADLTGRQTFSSRCSGCHGLDGRGGERGPNIATKREVQELSDAALFGILDKGISGTGMPSFHSLGKDRVELTVRYLRELQGKVNLASLLGDPSKGEALFLGKGECSRCHIVRGSGGFMGSDLSNYAATKLVSEIRGAITRPNVERTRKGQIVVATTRDGHRLRGIVRNEDNFSLQLQSLEGVFYSLTKSNLESVERTDQSLMPSDYGSRLSSDELDDLVSYLMKAARGVSSDGGSPTPSLLQ